MVDNIAIRKSEIPGLYIIDLILNGDERGWFKENYQKDKMEALGLPHFEVKQNNISYNSEKGVARGLHAEPWEKYISLANGKVFGAWVDLRQGSGFGKVFTIELSPQIAVFVPRGIANGYQTLTDNVSYTYLVNAHWSPSTRYVSINMFDPTLSIPWPISESQAIVSEKDKANPLLKDIKPMEF